MSRISFRSYPLLSIVAHALFWIAVYFIPFMVSPGMQPFAGLFSPERLLNHALLMFLFYFNGYFLLTHFYRKFGLTLYIAAFLVCLVSVILISGSVSPSRPGPEKAERTFMPPPDFDPNGGMPPPDLGPEHEMPPPGAAPGRPARPIGPPPFSLVVLLVGAISVVYRLILDKQEEERLRKEKETEALKTELSFLRSQISPHFIFNALNSTLALILKKSDLAADSLLKLSGLMRYMLYESDETRVPVAKEVEYINDYIELQMLRFGDSISIVKQFDSDMPVEKQIEPMLLIPFIENAFKHGVAMIAGPEIRIKLSTVDSTLVLIVENKFNSKGNEIKDKSSGIGLSNVKRRLELLYPGNYELKIEHSDSWHKIFLKLNLVS